MKIRLIARILVAASFLTTGSTSRAQDVRGVCVTCRYCTDSGCPRRGCTRSCCYSERKESPPPNEDSAERNREAQRDRDAQREAQIRREQQETDRQKAAEEKRKQEQFEKDKREALESLKGVSSGELGLKGVDTIKDHSTTFFGIKGVGETGIKDIKSAHDTRDVDTAWKQLHAGVYLSRLAAEAALKDDFEEASYLSEQAAQAMSGGRLGVQVPDAPPPPKPYSEKQLSQQTPPVVELYNLLLKSTNEAVSRQIKARQSIPQLTQRRKETATNVAEKRAALERLKQSSVNQAKQQGVKQQEDVPSEAEKALMAAEKDDAKAAQALDVANKEIAQAKSLLERNKNIFEKAQKNPEQAQDLLSHLQKGKNR